MSEPNGLSAGAEARVEAQARAGAAPARVGKQEGKGEDASLVAEEEEGMVAAAAAMS